MPELFYPTGSDDLTPSPPKAPAAYVPNPPCSSVINERLLSHVQVVAIGPGRTSADGEVVPMTVAKGDFIKFRNFAGSELSMQGVGYRVMTIGEILAKWWPGA